MRAIGSSAAWRTRAWQAVAGTAAALAMAVAAIQLARVDATFGAPFGPDRLIASIDTDPAREPGDDAAARAVLRDRPIDGRAYRVLAATTAGAAPAPAATPLLDIAAARWPRDRIARGLLAEHALAAGDIDGAIEHVDALLRVAPSTRATVLPLLAPHIGDAQLRDAFLTRLAQDPPWRAAFATALLGSAVPAADAEALLAALAQRRPLTDHELRTRVRLLQAAGNPAAARRVWLASQPGAPHPPDEAVFDGGFEREPTEAGFGWRMHAPAGISIERDRADAYEGGAALRMHFDGRPVRFDGIRQSLALAAGRYHFEAMGRDDTDALRPFEWALQCDGQGAALARAALPRIAGWQPATFDVDVPSACASQTLHLRSTARTLVERRMRGALRIDAIRIIPMRDTGHAR